jgi:hypothetical protein
MKQVSGDTFLAWAAEAGIVPDPRFKGSRKLVFQRGKSHSCYWCIPEDQKEAERLFELILGTVWGAGDMAVWPRDGSWWAYCDQTENIDPESPFAEIIHSSESPAALVGRDEMGELIKFLWFTLNDLELRPADLQLIPGDCAFIFMLDHHQTLHASSSDREKLEGIVELLEQGGFPLPDVAPDWTFKHPGTIREAD